MIPQQPINPSGVNVAPERLCRAVGVLEDGIAGGAMPGAVACAFRRGQMFLHEALGTLDGTRPTTLDSIYDLASITKPMATGASLLTLLEQGYLTLTASLADLLGEPAAHLGRVTVAHLLTHTSGLPAWIPCYDHGTGADVAVAAILRLPSGPPSTKYEYSCLNFILLQRIIERVSGKPLDHYAADNIFAPLGLKSVGYLPADSLKERIAPTVAKEGPDSQIPLVGVVHDSNARGIGGVSGNAGLFGTAQEVAIWGEALRSTPGEHPLFGAPTRARIFESQTKPDVGAHTLLFFAQGNSYCPAGDLLSPRAVGHSGYTGTFLTIDPAYDLTVAVLTNSVFLPEGKASWMTVRRKFLNALAAALL